MVDGKGHTGAFHSRLGGLRGGLCLNHSALSERLGKGIKSTPGLDGTGASRPQVLAIQAAS